MVVTHPAQQFALNDRAANYGDGVFTTMAVDKGRVALFGRHLSRLQHDCDALGLKPDLQAIVGAIRSAAAELQAGVLKVLISAGEGGRGYARTRETQTGYFVTQHPLPPHYTEWQSQGVRVNISPVQLANQPLLAGIKHLNRLEQVLIKRALSETQEQEALVCDLHGRVVEGSAANLFWYRNGRWFTPALSDCGVAGVMRSFVIDWLTTNDVPVEMGHYSLQQAQQAEAVMLTNALMQLVPVQQLINHQTHRYQIEPVLALTAAVRAAYEDEYDQLD